MGVLSRVKNAWNAFRLVDSYKNSSDIGTPSYGSRFDRTRVSSSNEGSIVSSIYTTIGMDVASVDLRHVKVDKTGRYEDDIDSPLNRALNFEPNMDQGPRAFRQEIATTLFDKGILAIVPVDTSPAPSDSEYFDIYTLRVGHVVSFYPKHVKVSVYNEKYARREDLILEKRFVAIVQNPLHAVMNEPNSTLQRLIRKLNLLDSVDEASASGKLDLIIQLPYVIKSEARKEAAIQRREDIELQLKGSKHGIAYTDATEKITQLNRPIENALLPQIEFLTGMLYSQLGITEEVMNGTADEATMLNYLNRTVEPIVDAVIEAMQRSFLGPIGFDKDERILYFKNPFKLVPLSNMAEISDTFTRNEIMTSNEIRGFIGLRPSKDPKADQLINSNMPQPDPAAVTVDPTLQDPAVVDTAAQDQAIADQEAQDAATAAAFDEVNAALDSVFKDLGV